MPRAFTLSALVVASLSASGVPAVAERVFADAGCVLADGESGVVESVIDGATVRLADGLVVRLAGLDVPVPSLTEAEDNGLADRARDGLSAIALGQTVLIRYGAVTRDRYGRATGQLFITNGEDSWVQAAMVDAGLARVAGFADDRACLGSLMELERVARGAGLGFWPELRVRSAYDPSLVEATGLYALVTGRIVSIGRTERTVYLNFGRNWAVDFTVTMTAAAAAEIEAEGGSLDALTGHEVRIRGWIEEWDGATIAVDHAEQIEVLDEDGGLVEAN
jgi:endonuclease YncB( thermonuclease family)